MLDELYPWLKAFHIMAVIAWMAGLFYLPRLYVHHVERASGNAAFEDVFKMMELKLLRVIMNPAMIAAWVLGILLVISIGPSVVFTEGWFQIKLVGLLAMTWFHMWLAARRKDFVNGTNTRSGRQFRIMNEVPTVLMIVIVLMVVVKPL